MFLLLHIFLQFRVFYGMRVAVVDLKSFEKLIAMFILYSWFLEGPFGQSRRHHNKVLMQTLSFTLLRWPHAA